MLGESMLGVVMLSDSPDVFGLQSTSGMVEQGSGAAWQIPRHAASDTAEASVLIAGEDRAVRIMDEQRVIKVYRESEAQAPTNYQAVKL